MDSTVQESPAAAPVKTSILQAVTQKIGETRKMFAKRLAGINNELTKPQPWTARNHTWLTGSRTKEIVWRKKLARRAVIRQANGGAGRPRISAEQCALALRGEMEGGGK